MIAELHAIPHRADRFIFRIGIARAFAHMLLVNQLHNLQTHAFLFATGLTIPLLDTHSANLPCLITIPLCVGCFVLGTRGPSHWTVAAALQLGVLAGAAVTPVPGIIDRVDVLSWALLSTSSVAGGTTLARLIRYM